MAIVRTLRGAGHTAYFAGGCVRDELLGLRPTDFDIATDATPDRIRSLFRRTAEVGAAFGVVLVTPGPDEGAPASGPHATVEVATFRSDGPYTDRRRPDVVHFSDPRSDAQRRDFTINALFLDPLASELPPVPPSPEAPLHPGHVIDYVGGLEDLTRRILRAVGNPESRLAEDHLRALRAVRLAARLGFEIDPATAAAIHRHARELLGLSRERIGEELRKMMAHPSRARAIELLQDLGLDTPVLEEPSARTPPRLLSTLSISRSGVPYTTCLAAWALDRGLPLDPAQIAKLVSRWRRSLCLSNEERDGLADTLRNLATLAGPWPTLSVAQQKRAAGAPGEAFSQALDILEARDPVAAAEFRATVASLASTPGGLAPEPWVSGDDLVAQGMAPGPRFKRLLDSVYDAQLEGRIGSPEEGLAMARELADREGI